MRLFTILSLATCLLTLPGCTQSGVVWGVDSWGRTLKIDQELYRVTGDSELYGPDGQRIALDDVPAYGARGLGLRSLARAEVDFRAREQAGERVLDALWVRHP
jgi:hypothetical protein